MTRYVDDTSDFTRHQLSAIWGMPDQDIVNAIAERMKARDEVPAIAVLDNQVLDGWHRVEAARKAGVGLHVRDLSDDADLAQVVLSGNMLRRRHSAVQATRLAIQTLESYGRQMASRGRPDKMAQAEPFMTNDEIAKACGVSLATVKRAKQELENERNPQMKVERERKREAMRQEAEEQDREYDEARLADERNRGLEQRELEATRAELAAVRAANENDSEVTTHIAAMSEDIGRLQADLEAAWRENDLLQRKVDALQSQNASLRRQLKTFDDHARKQFEKEVA